MGVPECAIAAAQGYAEESGLPLRDGLVRNRYIHRTFIQPTDELRREGVLLKYNPMPEVLEGQRVVVVDDSIVRGTNTLPIVKMLRQAGATWRCTCALPRRRSGILVSWALICRRGAKSSLQRSGRKKKPNWRLAMPFRRIAWGI